MAQLEAEAHRAVAETLLQSVGGGQKAAALFLVADERLAFNRVCVVIAPKDGGVEKRFLCLLYTSRCV